MAWQTYKHYFCKNVQHCEYARNDHAYRFSKDDPSIHRCEGNSNDGCGALLEAGKTVHPQRYWLAGVIVVGAASAALGFPLYHYLYPPALSGYGFTNKTTKVDESQAYVQVEIFRSKTARPAVVQFVTVEGSASADADYLPESGEVAFNANEYSKKIRVTILPDEHFNERVEDFSILLTNTQNQERHTVFVEEVPSRRESINTAQALVRNLSVVSMDIAAYGARLEAINAIMRSGSIHDEALYLEYQQVRSSNESNLRRSRERYVELFRDLESVDRRSVFIAFDAWIASLSRKGFTQQQKATVLSKAYFEVFLNHGIMEMDMWAKELESIVPDAEVELEQPRLQT